MKNVAFEITRELRGDVKYGSESVSAFASDALDKVATMSENDIKAAVARFEDYQNSIGATTVLSSAFIIDFL